MDAPKLTVPDLADRKSAGDKLVMITCYDATFARLLDDAGVDILLVGDCLGMVVQGQATTLPVTLDEMVYHAGWSPRAPRGALVRRRPAVRLLPASRRTRSRVAVRMLIKDGRRATVKLEGGVPDGRRPSRAVTRVDIPVMAHIGLTPQSFHRMGGHKVQGRREAPGSRERLLDDAARGRRTPAPSAVVLEGMPLDLGREITASSRSRPIGIGAGPVCDGQVLVLHDSSGSDRDATAASSRKPLRRTRHRGDAAPSRPSPTTCAPAASRPTPTRYHCRAPRRRRGMLTTRRGARSA